MFSRGGTRLSEEMFSNLFGVSWEDHAKQLVKNGNTKGVKTVLAKPGSSAPTRYYLMASAKPPSLANPHHDLSPKDVQVSISLTFSAPILLQTHGRDLAILT